MKRPSAHITLTQLKALPVYKNPQTKAVIDALEKELKGGSKKCGVKTQDSPEKQWLQDELQFWCNKNLLQLQAEYCFAPPRKWRFDWTITTPQHSSLQVKIAVEYEGIFSEKSRHTTVGGFAGDVEKYNEAVKLGWKLVRVTAVDYKTIIDTLNRLV
jgi:hypothetical protein